MFYIILIVVFVLFYIFFPPSKNSHKLKIKLAKRIIKKVRSIEHDGAKIMYLKKVDPYAFEEMLLTCFKDKGYKIKRNKKYSGDGGIDGRVWFDGKWAFVQAKRYRLSIQNSHVLSFIDLCNEYKTQGFFVHTGVTPESIKKIVKNSPVTIISGSELLGLIQKRNTKRRR